MKPRVTITGAAQPGSFFWHRALRTLHHGRTLRHDNTTLCTHTTSTNSVFAASSGKMPQHHYTTEDWLREAAGDSEAYDNDSDDYSPWDLDGWFYDGDDRYYRPGEGILGAEVYRHSNNESQEPVEPGQVSDDNDDRAQDGPEEWSYTAPYLYHPMEQHSSSDDEVSTDTDELYCEPDHPASNGTQQAHHVHDNVLNETEEKEVVAVCVGATLHRYKTNIGMLGEPRVD